MFVPGVSGKTVVGILVVFCVQQVQTKCKFISKAVVCGSTIIFKAQAHCKITEASRIISVSVSKQISRTHCHKTSEVVYYIRHRANYGFRDNILWARDRCRAKFSVCYRPRVSTSHTIQSTSTRDLKIPSQMTSKHSRTNQTYATVTFSSNSKTLILTSRKLETLSSQREFKVSSTTVSTTHKTALNEFAYFSSLHMNTSSSTDESLTSDETTMSKTSMVHKADTSDVLLVAIVIPIVGIIIGALVATFFIYKRKCYRDSKSKAISAKMDCNVSVHGNHSSGCNVMIDHSTDWQSGNIYATVNHAHKQQTLRTVASKESNSDSEPCYIDTIIVEPEIGKLKIKDGDRLNQHLEVDGQIDSLVKGALELSDENIGGETTEGNDDYHSYFILEKQRDPNALYHEKTDIQMLPDDEYNVINIKSKEILRDSNYDALDMQGGNIDRYSDEYSHLSQNQARVQYEVNYSHCKFNN